ncbi:related to L-aminoadipate-semialdehyde dehydrogenase-phosphopantetheinyl transferase [Zygosaccharomyces bailii]|nr:related to L-aminoadipate-semialdehyde dehydrogenase-phosphopantetheinyl transferase [Zygosaccharomyces bailii]
MILSIGSTKNMQQLLQELHSTVDWHGIILVNCQCSLLYDDFVFEEAMRLLPLDQQAQILHKKLFSDRCRALCNKLLQVVGCSIASGIHPNRLKFSQGQYGKPDVEDQNVTFSMSNGENFVGQYLHRSNTSVEVGLDLSSTNDYVGDEELLYFKDVFSDQELECLLKCDHSQRHAMFAYLWSLKECYTKFTGLGLNSDLININLRKLNLPQPSLSIIRSIKGHIMLFYSKWITETEIVTVCHEEGVGKCDIPKTYYLTFSELLSLIQVSHGQKI